MIQPIVTVRFLRGEGQIVLAIAQSSGSDLQQILKEIGQLFAFPMNILDFIYVALF